MVSGGSPVCSRFCKAGLTNWRARLSSSNCENGDQTRVASEIASLRKVSCHGRGSVSCHRLRRRKEFAELPTAQHPPVDLLGLPLKMPQLSLGGALDNDPPIAGLVCCRPKSHSHHRRVNIPFSFERSTTAPELSARILSRARS